MAVSGDSTFAYTATDIITQARNALGVGAAEEPLTAAELDTGMFWLNLMLKQWEADGVRTWVLEEAGPLTLVQAQAAYVFGPAGDVTEVPFDMDQIRINRGGIDLEMEEMTRRDYFGMPNKTSQGYPTQYYYDRQRDTATLYLWPAPGNISATLNWTQRRRMYAILAAGNSLDLPEEWGLAIIDNLAALLIPIYGKADSKNAQLVLIRAQEEYKTIKNFDTAEGLGSISITPASYGQAR